MSISVLLRLVREPLASGQLVGQVEVVETGERTVVRSAGELIGYLRATLSQDGDEDGSSHGGPSGGMHIVPPRCHH